MHRDGVALWMVLRGVREVRTQLRDVHQYAVEQNAITSEGRGDSGLGAGLQGGDAREEVGMRSEQFRHACFHRFAILRVHTEEVYLIGGACVLVPARRSSSSAAFSSTIQISMPSSLKASARSLFLPAIYSSQARAYDALASYAT